MNRQKVELLNEIRRDEAMRAAKRTYQQYEKLTNRPVTPQGRITAEMLQRIENIR